MKYLALLLLTFSGCLPDGEVFTICHEPEKCFEFAHLSCKNVRLLMFRDMVINRKTGEQGYYLAYVCEDKK